MATKTETSADDGIELKKPAVPKVCRNGSALQTPVFAIKCGALLEKVLVGWGWVWYQRIALVTAANILIEIISVTDTWLTSLTPICLGMRTGAY